MSLHLHPEYIELRSEIKEYLVNLVYKTFDCENHQYCKDRFEELRDLCSEVNIPQEDIPYMKDLLQHIIEYENNQVINRIRSKFYRVQ